VSKLKINHVNAHNHNTKTASDQLACIINTYIAGSKLQFASHLVSFKPFKAMESHSINHRFGVNV